MVTMERKTKTIRVSLDLYDKLTEIGKKNETYASVIERLFKENDMQGIVTEK